jgi:hypothetical protein
MAGKIHIILPCTGGTSIVHFHCKYEIDWFQSNAAKPCILFKREHSNLTIAVIHVDNCYLIGSDANLDDLVKKLENHGLKIKVEMEMKVYLRCVNDRSELGWDLGQPHTIV